MHARESCPCMVGLRLLSYYSRLPVEVLDLRGQVFSPPLCQLAIIHNRWSLLVNKPGVRKTMSNQWKQLSTERQAPGAREIERLPAAAALGFKVDISLKNLGHFQGSLIDFNAKSLAVDITALAGTLDN